MINNTSINCKYGGPYSAVGPDAAKTWKRSYSSIYSAHYLEHPTLGPMNIGFCHDENKNSCNQQNTINPIFHPTCVSGTDYTGYFAILSAVWTKNIQSNNWGQSGYNNDIGPILWPSVGYVSSDNTNASQGLLQPTSIISGNYIYIFIWDKRPLGKAQGQEGRNRGIKVVRTTIANCNNPLLYEVYYKNSQGVETWLPSLPSGFTKETMLNYVKIQGPKSSGILFDEISGNTEFFIFSVAKVNNQNYFIGSEEYVDNNDKGRQHIAVRFSYDLVNWSERKKI